MAASKISGTISKISTHSPAFRWHIRYLEAIYDRDQHPRLRMHVNVTPDDVALFEGLDEDNQHRITRYLHRYGWPDPHTHGEKAAKTAFLIIQHAPQDYMERHIHFLRDAVCMGRARRTTLAFMQDRLLLYRGKKQIFGTQYMYDPSEEGIRLQPRPLANPARVNQRRLKAGFDETMEEYLAESTAFLRSVKET